MTQEEGKVPQQKIPLMQMLTWRESTTPRENAGNAGTRENKACGYSRKRGVLRTRCKYIGNGEGRKAAPHGSAST